MNSRREFITAAVAAVALPRTAFAQSETVRIIVGFSAGAGADLIARKLAFKLQAATGSTHIVENIPGASGRLAANHVKNALPDGRTILLTPATTITLFPHVQRVAGYDPVKDFVPVTSIASIQLGFMAGPGAKSRATLADYLKWAKLDPKNQTYASPGAGSIAHFLGVMFAKASGVDLVHVPYKGSAPAMQDLLSGQVPAYAGIIGRPIIGEHKSGRVKVLATAQPKRSPLLPDVPTFAEAGYPSVRASEWTGIFLPAGTPASAVETLNRNLLAALQSPDMLQLLDDNAMDVAGASSAAFGTQVRSEHAAWAQVVRSSGFKPED